MTNDLETQMSGEDHTGYPSNTVVLGWLIGLLAAGVVLTLLPLGKAGAIILIFTVAVIKAFLVARHFMHLRSESLLIYAIAGLPVLLLIGMVLSLVPDIIFNR